MKITTKVTPWLGFKSEALEAAEFYCRLIPDSRVERITRNPDSGDVLVVGFVLGGLPLCALNTGQDWQHSNAFSLSVGCKDQTEIDFLWEAFGEGGSEQACGWVTDRFGLAWQVVPDQIAEWISSDDPVRSKRVLEAVWGMVKLDLKVLEAAYRGK